jgi:DNA-directed RNA polymerase subunit RPC12/RpoP
MTSDRCSRCGRAVEPDDCLIVPDASNAGERLVCPACLTAGERRFADELAAKQHAARERPAGLRRV